MSSKRALRPQQHTTTPVASWWLAITLFLAIAVPALVPGTTSYGLPRSEDPYADAAYVELEDGSYQVDITFEGGSGRAHIESPVLVTVKDNRATATVLWSSPHYDYMVVSGKTYLPTNTEGNSQFDIPILAWDEPFGVIGDTTAMSQPHEITYQLTFNLVDVQPASFSPGTGWLFPAVITVAALLVCITIIRKRLTQHL